VNFIAASVALLVVAVAATYIITVITFGIETCLGQPAMKLQNSVSVVLLWRTNYPSIKLK